MATESAVAASEFSRGRYGSRSTAWPNVAAIVQAAMMTGVGKRLTTVTQ